MSDPFYYNMQPTEAMARLNQLAAAGDAINNRIYPGTYNADPATRPDGTAPQVGDVYFNAAAGITKRFNGVIWVASDMNAADLLKPTGSTLVGHGDTTVAAALNGKVDRTGAEFEGKVGINVDNPLSQLHVNEPSTAPSYVTVGNNNNGMLLGVNGAGTAQILAYGGQPIKFGHWNGGVPAEYAQFDSEGNLLIGKSGVNWHSAGRRNVEIYGQVSTIFGMTTDGGNAYFYNTGGNGEAYGDKSFAISTAGGQRLRVDSGGGVTIETGGAALNFSGTLLAQINNYRTGDMELVNRTTGTGIGFYVGAGAFAGKFNGAGQFLVGTEAVDGKITVSAPNNQPGLGINGKTSGNVSPDLSISRVNSGGGVGTAPCIQFNDNIGNAMLQAAENGFSFWNTHPGYWRDFARFTPGGSIWTIGDTATFGSGSIFSVSSGGQFNNATVNGDVIYKGYNDVTPVVLGMHNGSSIRVNKDKITFRPNNAVADKMVLDADGNLLVGVTGATQHTFYKGAAVGTAVVDVSYCTVFFVGDGYNYSAAETVQKVLARNSTGRSINAAGTINANGSDYAEYMTKADECGVVAKGQIVGVDAAGKLTDKWADSVSFMIKSTDPSYVGGDIWGSQLVIGARPEQPTLELPPYVGAPEPGQMPIAPPAPPTPPELVEPAEPVAPEPLDELADEESRQAHALLQTEYERAIADFDARLRENERVRQAYADALRAHAESVASYERNLDEFWDALVAYDRDRDAWHSAIAVAQRQHDEVAMPAYRQALAAHAAKLEAARQKVDRIAYCGQVPVNVLGATAGQYVVPVPDGESIGGQLVDDADITFAQYRRAVGIVQNILPDGRANVRVKVA